MMKAKAKPKAKAAKPKAAGRKGGRRRSEGPSGAQLESILHEVTSEPLKKHLDHWAQVQCPYCGENFEVHVESAEDGQTMYEDCHVCCKPISLHIQVEDDEVHISAYRA